MSTDHFDQPESAAWLHQVVEMVEVGAGAQPESIYVQPTSIYRGVELPVALYQFPNIEVKLYVEGRHTVWVEIVKDGVTYRDEMALQSNIDVLPALIAAIRNDEFAVRHKPLSRRPAGLDVRCRALRWYFPRLD